MPVECLKKFDKDFLVKFVTTFKALFVRILMVVHASLAVDFLITEKNVGGAYYILVVPIIVVAIEGIAVTIVQTRQDVSRFWPICAISYLASVIPIIWISEFDAMETKTSTYGTLIGMWTKLGMFFVLIAGRWMVSVGDLSRVQITVLLLALVGHAPDCMSLLNTLNEKMDTKTSATSATKDDDNQTYKLVVVLTVFTLSAVQFAIKTPDIEDGSDKKRWWNRKKKYDTSKYFDFSCCVKGRIPLPNIESKRLTTFKDSVVDKAKQLSARAREAKEKAEEAWNKVEDAKKKVEEAKAKAEAMVAEGKAKIEEVKGMIDDAKAVLEGAKENAQSLVEEAKKKAQAEAEGRLSSLKGSVMDKTKAAKERALKNEKVKKCATYLGVLLHLFIALALHAGPVFAVRLVMSIRFDVFNEVHIFFLVKNGFEVLVCIYRFIQTVRNSKSLEKDFNLDSALEQLDEIPRELPSVKPSGDGDPSGGGPSSQFTDQV